MASILPWGLEGESLCKDAAAAKSLQSCPTLCNPIDGSPPGSAVPGILQARTLEWVAVSFSNAWKWKVKGKSLSHVQLFVTPWTAARQTPPPLWFSMWEYWSGVPLPSPSVKMIVKENIIRSLTQKPRIISSGVQKSWKNSTATVGRAPVLPNAA